jgi:hypothetical protein
MGERRVVSDTYLRDKDGPGFANLIPEIYNFQVSEGVALTEEMIPMREGTFKNRPIAGGKKEG